MAKIHGLVYVAVGLFVSIFSWKVNYEKFIFFFYIGWVFVFVGIVKLIFGFMKRVNKKEDKHQKVQTQKQRMQQFKRCSRCGNVMRLHDRFCSKCGSSV